MPIIIIGVTLYIIFSSFADLDDVVRSMGAIDLRVLSIVLALSLMNYALRFGRWALFLSDPSSPVPLGRHFAIYTAGFALTATPAKAGEAVRTLYLKPFGIGYRRCLAALYAERLFDVIVVSILAMLIFTASGVVTRWLGLVGAGVAAVLIAGQHPVAVAFLERLASRLPGRWVATLTDAATGFLSDVRSMMTARLVILGMLLGFLAWGAEGLGLYLVAQALGIDVGPWLAIGIYAAAMLAGALSFLPGGLGSTEVVMISLLVSVGATAPAAVAATAIVRLATLWFAVALGMGAWLGIETLHGPRAAGSGRSTEKVCCHARSRGDPEG